MTTTLLIVIGFMFLVNLIATGYLLVWAHRFNLQIALVLMWQAKNQKELRDMVGIEEQGE